MTYTVQFRRKRQGKTNYKKRMALLKSSKPRLVVRKKNKNIIAQIVNYQEKGDKILVTSTSGDLAKYGWKAGRSNISAAYLVGLLVAKKTKEKEAVLDIGLQTPTKGSKVFAVLKGAIDGGLKIPYTEDNLPSEERIQGSHISDYLAKKPKNQFQKYEGIDIKDMFTKVKSKIMEAK